MRKNLIIFMALILGFLVFQDAYSKGFKDLYLDPSIRRVVLWRIFIQPPDYNLKIGNKMYTTATVDSVFIEDFYTKEKFYIVKEKDVSQLSPNTYYLALALAGCGEESAAKGRCFLAFPKEDCLERKEKSDCILPDTPENREYLIKKWAETKVIYTDPKPMPRRKGRDID